MNPVKSLLIASLLMIGSTACTSTNSTPPPVSVPSTDTERVINDSLAAYDARLGDISAYLEVASHEITDKPTVAILTPARVLAGVPNGDTVKEAKGMLTSAKGGDLGPSRAAVITAKARADTAITLRADLSNALETDRASLKAYLKERDAAFEAEIKKERARLWNILGALMIAVGALVATGGFFVRLLASQVPIFGPKAAGAIMGAGSSLTAGGVLIYATGPHLSILAVTVGIAAALALIAGALIYANKAHERGASPQAGGENEQVSFL